MGLENKIESVKIQGFRSLSDVELNDLPNAAVLIGPNGSGKSNFIRFFEMLGRMLESPGRLGEFVARQGGADDQLFGGNARTPRMNAEIVIQAESGSDSYKFTLTHDIQTGSFLPKRHFVFKGSETILLGRGNIFPVGTSKLIWCQPLKLLTLVQKSAIIWLG